MAGHRITMLPGPPTVFQSISAHPDLAGFDLSSLRGSPYRRCGRSGRVRPAYADELQFETVVTGYGLTETTGTVEHVPPRRPTGALPTTVGRPLSGVEVKVVDEAGVELPAGGGGEIWCAAST